MTPEVICAWKVRMDLASERIDREKAETPHDPVRNRAIAEVLAVDAWMRRWRRQHEPERVAGKIRALKLLHGTALCPAA